MEYDAGRARGWFHGWTRLDVDDEGETLYAVIEAADGSVTLCKASWVRFLDPRGGP